ncbi:MAG: ferritin family protein [Deltaproteobacteria bacterium]|nr:ferritin family protein [Deltaproteobacteria bacterium]MDA8308139.1 ferritin family protein [Deltaproteobacteria bacterium]
MKDKGAQMLEIMCAALEIKEKMKSFYSDAAGKCSDRVGTETFQMLKDIEQKHLERLQQIYADLSKGGSDVDACRFYDIEAPDRAEVLRKLRQKRKTVAEACLDDVAAIESGMELENKGIDMFSAWLKEASGPAEREFLNHMIAEERSHYILLADLKFYYIDTEHWLMEKSKSGLDGA